jgi:hypothetical protein
MVLIIKDVVILTRKRHMEQQLQTTYENNIPIVSSSLLLSPVFRVFACINILRYINNKKDTESKVNFLVFLARII